jgi:hypothetical protein
MRCRDHVAIRWPWRSGAHADDQGDRDGDGVADDDIKRPIGHRLRHDFQRRQNIQRESQKDQRCTARAAVAPGFGGGA